MSDTEAVKRALTRLATESPDRGRATGRSSVERTGDDHARVVHDATQARSDLDEAARFVATGGVERLRVAVEHTGTGTETLASFEQFRRSCRWGVGHYRPGHVTDLSAEPKEVPD